MELTRNSEMGKFLSGIGVCDSTLTSDEKKSLDEKGYVILENVLDEHRLKDVRLAFEKAMQKEGFEDGRVIEKGQDSLGDLVAKEFRDDNVLREGSGMHVVENLVNKGEAFDQLYIEPQLLAAVQHVYNTDFKVSALNAVEAVQGQRLPEPSTEESINCVWLLDDISATDGTLWVLPGTHLPNVSTESDKANNEFLSARAGSVIIFNRGISCGSTINQSNKNSRFVHCEYIERNKPQKLNQLEYVRRNTFLRLTDAAKYILSVNDK